MLSLFHIVLCATEFLLQRVFPFQTCTTDCFIQQSRLPFETRREDDFLLQTPRKILIVGKSSYSIYQMQICCFLSNIYWKSIGWYLGILNLSCNSLSNHYEIDNESYGYYATKKLICNPSTTSIDSYNKFPSQQGVRWQR